MATRATSGLSAGRLQRSLHFLRRQRGEAPSMEQFALAANAGLADLIGADLVTLSYCELRTATRSVVTWPRGALGADDTACFDRHFHAHPLVRFHSTHPHAGAQRMSDSVTASAFHKSALYADYYRRIRIDHVVAVPVRIDADRVVSFVLNRSRRDFSPADCALLDTVRFQLGAVYMAQEARLRWRRTHEQLNAALSGAGMALILLDAQRRVQEVSVTALRWLAYAGVRDGIRHGERLPEQIDRWMRARLGPSWVPGDPRPLELATPTCTLRVHLLQGEDDITLLIERLPSATGRALDGLTGLTGREREIVGWLAAGKSNIEIATILGISPRTVHKHLERVFRKLGVENRTAAVMRALQIDANAS